ncbi:hypothetical protein GGF46_002141 [Coemansia sp. RSA 552]|nr:hypothetical protein GGF46_002141 [Coemansia sp. RSA 552]
MADTQQGSDKLQQLSEMFPGVDRDVVKMILSNSSGNLQLSMNTLLEMTDPSFTPDQEDATRQTAMAQDAELARKLADAELRTASYQRQYGQPQGRPPWQFAGAYPANNLHAPPPPPPRRRHSAAGQEREEHSRKAKIRDMFRLGKRSSNSRSSQPADSAQRGGGGHSRNPSNSEPMSRPPRPAADEAGLDARVRMPHTLESDFTTSSNSSLSRGNAQQTQQTQQQQQGGLVAADDNDVFGLFRDDPPADTGLASYAPLNPSKNPKSPPVSNSPPMGAAAAGQPLGAYRGPASGFGSSSGSPGLGPVSAGLGPAAPEFAVAEPVSSVPATAAILAGQQQQHSTAPPPAAIARNPTEQSIDLENPFLNNPLLIPSEPATPLSPAASPGPPAYDSTAPNPFQPAASTTDHNPFRARNHV